MSPRSNRKSSTWSVVNFKKNTQPRWVVDLSLRYGHVILVSRYLVLTGARRYKLIYLVAFQTKTLDNFSVSSQQLIPNYSINEGFWPSFHQINTPPRLGAIWWSLRPVWSRGKDGLPRTTRGLSLCYWREIDCISHDLIGSRRFFCYLTHAMA